MGKRGLGIPSVDLARRSRSQRAASLGIGLGAISGPPRPSIAGSQVAIGTIGERRSGGHDGTVGYPSVGLHSVPVPANNASSSGLHGDVASRNSVARDVQQPSEDVLSRLREKGISWPPAPPSPEALAFLANISDDESEQAARSAPVCAGERLRANNPHRVDAPTLRTGRQLAPKRCRPSDRVVDLDTALGQYQREKYAASTLASRSSLAATWHEYYDKAMALQAPQHRRPPWPLTPTILAPSRRS